MSQAIGTDGAVVDALRARRQVILDNIRDNDEAGVNYQKVVIHVLGLVRITICDASYHINNFTYLQEIKANERHRCELQDMIEEAISNNGNKTYLRILSQYRILVSRYK
jgi:kinesin family protein 18/19